MDGEGRLTLHQIPVTEAQIERLVHGFYAKARADDVIGPIFAAAVADWPAHLAKLCDFWSSLVLRTGRYDGRPLAPHLTLPIEGHHFDRWLALFEETAQAVLPGEAVPFVIDRARRIADSFELAVGTAQGRIASPRHAR